MRTLLATAFFIASIGSASAQQEFLATTSPYPFSSFNDGINDSVTPFLFENTDSSASAEQRFAAFIGNFSAGTGSGAVSATTFGLGIGAIKNNWQTTTVPGQFVALGVNARGGYNNAVSSGDTAGINANVGVSYSNNFANALEADVGYYPEGSTAGSLAMNVQFGSIRATGLDTGGNTGVGFAAQAQNGLQGYAIQVSNQCASPLYGTCGKWIGGYNYIYDDGTDAPYIAYQINQQGQLVLAGPGALGTNQKTIRVGGSVTDSFEIVNASGTAVIANLTDAGLWTASAGFKSGTTAGVACHGSPTSSFAAVGGIVTHC